MKEVTDTWNNSLLKSNGKWKESLLVGGSLGNSHVGFQEGNEPHSVQT